MPKFRAYPSAKEVPSRMTRKRLRREIFWENSQAWNKQRYERKKAKKEN